MRLTKEDLLRLPKERLAEIIVEMQEEKNLTLTTPEKDVPHFIPFQTRHPYCWEPGGTCTNPCMDCINCPKHSNSNPYVYTGQPIESRFGEDVREGQK